MEFYPSVVYAEERISIGFPRNFEKRDQKTSFFVQFIKF